MNSKLLLLIATATLAGCKTTRTTEPELIAAPQVAPPAQALPKAVVYKMTGDATPENVPVSVNPTTGEIVSFPGPRDVIGQEPIALGNGWYLDRRGIGPNSRFTRWTYSEYQQLSTPPTLSEIKEALIPDARPTDITRLPMTTTEAAADTASIKKFLGII